MRISIFNSKELQGIVLLLKGADRTIAKELRRQTKSAVDPMWKRAIADNVGSRTEAKIFAETARVQVSDQNVTLRSAHIGRSFSGGLTPSQSFGAFEFGAKPEKRTYEATSSKGKRYKVTRNTRAQLPAFKKAGHVVFPAAAEVIPRIASLWVQTVVRTFNEIIEGKSRG